VLTWEDCLALSDLTDEEVAAIAAHERCPDMVAAELGNYLMATAVGRKRIEKMIREDIQAAATSGDAYRSALLKCVLRHFIEAHPSEDGTPRPPT